MRFLTFLKRITDAPKRRKSFFAQQENNNAAAATDRGISKSRLYRITATTTAFPSQNAPMRVKNDAKKNSLFQQWYVKQLKYGYHRKQSITLIAKFCSYSTVNDGISISLIHSSPSKKSFQMENNLLIFGAFKRL